MNVTAKLILDVTKQTKLSEVRNLSLNGTNIREIPSSIFNKLINLESLDLSDNSISFIPILRLPMLRELKLSNNNINMMPEINCNGINLSPIGFEDKY
jgi:Leucine-rich repeat (LRR) protein